MGRKIDTQHAPIRVRTSAKIIRTSHLLRDAGVDVTTSRIAALLGMRRAAVKNAILRSVPADIRDFTLVGEVEHRRRLTITRVRWILKLHRQKDEGPMTLTQLARLAGYERTSFLKFLRNEPELRREIDTAP